MKEKFKEYFKNIFKGHVLSYVFLPCFAACLIIIEYENIKKSIVDFVSTPPGLFSFWIIIACLFILTFLFFKERLINIIDYMLYYFIFTCILLVCYSLYSKLFEIEILIIIALLIIILIINRIYLLFRKKKAVQKESIIDLKQIVEKKIDLSSYKECLAIEEADVDYDLLDRGIIINTLYKLIFQLETNKHYIIGLDGVWGSGKTTIINNVLDIAKKEKEYDKNYIVKFNPCIYENDKKMLEAFITDILDEIGIELNNVRDLVNDVVGSYFNSSNSLISKTIAFVSNIFCFSYRKKNIKDIVDNALLKKNNKLVIIIDDFDRIRIDRVILLITFLDQVIQFKNTCIVILYDRQIVEKSLEDQYKYRNSFIDKYINFDYKVPVLLETNVNNVKKLLLII